MEQKIIELCAAMGAPADQEELTLLLVRAVYEQLAAGLKEGAVPEDCGPAFPLAAAMVVTDRLSRMTGEGSGVTSFTAGDLTIRRESSGGQGGKSLSTQAAELLAPWMRPVGFCFQGVEG